MESIFVQGKYLKDKFSIDLNKLQFIMPVGVLAVRSGLVVTDTEFGLAIGAGKVVCTIP